MIRRLPFVALAMSVSFAALACPKGAPNGFIANAEMKERGYHDPQKLVQVVVKCDERVTPDEASKALSMIGEAKEINKQLSYAVMGDGIMRVYVMKNADQKHVTQLAVVAKTAKDLEKQAPVLEAYLQGDK